MKVSGSGLHLITSLRIHHGILINQIMQKVLKTVCKWHIATAFNGMTGNAKKKEITYVREGKTKRIDLFVSIHSENVWID